MNKKDGGTSAMSAADQHCDLCGAQCKYRYYYCDKCKIRICPERVCSRKPRVFAEEEEPCSHDLELQELPVPTVNLSAMQEKLWCKPVWERAAASLGHLSNPTSPDSKSYAFLVWGNLSLIHI